MQSKILILSFSLIAFISGAQAVGKIYVKGDPLEVSIDKADHVYFKPFKSNLSDSAKQYLNYFGKAYKDSVLNVGAYTLKLDPASSGEEQKKNRRIAAARADAISNYLMNKFGIKIYKTTLLEKRAIQ